MKIAYLGFGKSTKRYHLPYVMINKRIDVSKIYVLTHDTLEEEVYKEKGIQFTTDIEEIFTDVSIELIVICTPPDTHFSLAKKSLLAGKHVLLEKPFCETVEEATQLFSLAKEKKLHIMAYQNRRFDGDYILLKKLLNSNTFGDVKEVTKHFDYFRPEMTPSIVKKDTYGALYGLGVHAIDQMIALFGKPTYISYDVKSQILEGNNDDYFELQLFYEKQLKVIIKTSHIVAIPTPKLIVQGTLGNMQKYGMDKQERDLKNNVFPGNSNFGKDDSEEYAKIVTWDHALKINEYTKETPIGNYGEIYENMYNVIKNGQQKCVQDTETILVLEIIEKAFVNGKDYPKIIEI